MLLRRKNWKFLAIAKDGGVAIPADSSSAAFNGMSRRPYYIDAFHKIAGSAKLLKIDLMIFLTLQCLHMPINVAIRTGQEVTDFMSGLIVIDIFSPANDPVRLAVMALISAHSADVAEQHSSPSSLELLPERYFDRSRFVKLPGNPHRLWRALVVQRTLAHAATGTFSSEFPSYRALPDADLCS